jgi:hypothetical protein
MKNRKLAASFLSLTIAGLAFAAPAQASGWFEPPPAGATRNPVVYFDSSVTSVARSSAINGMAQWNTAWAISYGAHISYTTSVVSPIFNPDTAPPVGTVGATIQGIDGQGGTLAYALKWNFTSHPTVIHSSLVVFDPAEKWYDGTGTSFAGKTDRFGVSTHEFGHVFGLLHTPAGSQWCPSNTANATSVMCPSIATGVYSWRYPFSLDRSSYRSIYGGV